MRSNHRRDGAVVGMLMLLVGPVDALAAPAAPAAQPALTVAVSVKDASG